MKKAEALCMLLFTCLFLGLLTGFVITRSQKTVSVSTFPQKELPSASASSSGSEASEPSGPLDINIATAEELEALPGIGPKIAERIVDYRTEHGPFHNVQELGNVSGIGKDRLKKLIPHIIAGGWS